MYVLQQLNIHSNIRDQMTDGYMYVGQPTYNYTRDIHIECSKQFHWNLYLYVSGQSGPFWAVQKLL